GATHQRVHRGMSWPLLSPEYREPHYLWAIVIYVPRRRLAVVLSLSRPSGQTAGAGRVMVFNGRGWSRSSYTCHSACEILTAGAVGRHGQAFTGRRSRQPRSHSCASEDHL